ncbi:PP2C family protein-serine/threonine phosphatase [Streptomyces sp. NBC_01803]|uniref:PP2C family protein-serine/threonine phosphatase n=1 Tax=Streptomyces sp. NBC_01803 TaxID=2975946 RepID=UPI002DDB3FA6|nr:PP2C family serine/threonine-protein phosphatase [Streptomyces sp. NBC_01803]WSA45333.1 protein phosphatase 2C domain-containing protein [Streptomyces sp. NBC_01803]
MSLSLRFAAGSHTGMIRDHNEDSGYAGPRLLAIADGMGGQAAGEVASSEVISTLVQLDDDIPGSDILTSLDVSVQRANDQLRSMVAEDPRLDGMGTTLTALLWTGQRLGLVHVGDSRAYLLRGGELLQITQDHTWVQRLVDEGRITEEEATTHPQRSLLMRALGSADHIEADLSIREVRPGDRYLLCSDGLSGVVSAETLRDALSTFAPPQDTVRELIELALRGGGPDNITCIVADVLDVDTQESDTLARQLYDAPQIVGAVAEAQAQSAGDIPQTPASRAAELGRPPATPPGAPASGVAGPPTGAFGAFTDADYLPARPGRRALKSTALIALALIVVGGGLYAGYRWTQGQYYIGANGDHVALYQGVSQDLGPLSLSSVEKDHPEIQLDHLPEFQRSRVEESISTGSLGEAETRIAELAAQAEACRLLAEQERANEQNEQGDPGDGKDAANPDTDPQTPSLSERQRELARDC